MRTTRSSASVLPPAPTVTSSRVRINRENLMLYVFIIILITCVCINYEPALREKSDDEMKEKGKGKHEVEDEDKDESDEDKDEGEDESDEDMDEGKDAPVIMRFGPPKRRSGPSGSGHVDGNIYFFTTIIFYLFIFHLDIANLQLPTIQAPANGSSRSTGGTLRGRALGIAPNIGDVFDDMHEEVRPLARGRINVTIVEQPPGDVVIENPTSHLKVMSPCYETFAPLMKKVAKSYSPVRNHNYRVYALDQQQWSIMGRYNVVVEDDESVVWEKDEGGNVTHILLVGFINLSVEI